jgi:hypothetical protein
VSATYEIVTHNRAGSQRVHRYTTDDRLEPGSLVQLAGRWWLVVRLEDGDAPRAHAKPARYRLRLRHPEGREDLGAFRRYRPDGPKIGHALTTIEDGQPISWQVVEEGLAEDEEGEPYLDLIAERDYAELEELPDHELEHILARRDDDLPAGAVATLERADQAGLSVELVALDPGEAPDWAAAERYIDTLILEEIEDDLLEQCGVRPDADPRPAWLGIVKERLREDLERFRGDIEGDHDEIEEWDFRGGRIFAAVGSYADESDPDSGYGWLCRLVDASALGAAGFERVRRASLV